MDGPLLVTIRSSDGISYPIGKKTLLRNTSYFNDTLNASPLDPSQPITINLVETAKVLGPLIQFLNPSGLLPTISLFGLERIFAIFQAALKYGFISTVEKTREDIKSEVSGNPGVRDLALGLAMECGDQELIGYISELVNEKRSSTNGININGSSNASTNQNQHQEPPSNINSNQPRMGNPEKPEPDSSYSSAFDTLSPGELNPAIDPSPTASSITITAPTPYADEKNVNPEGTTYPPSFPGSGLRSAPGIGPTMPMPMELPVSMRFPVEYMTVIALQEFLRLGRVDKKDPTDISEREASLEQAIEKLKARVLAQGPQGEKEWADVYRSILEEAKMMEGRSTTPSLPLSPPSIMPGPATPTTPLTPFTAPTPNSARPLRPTSSIEDQAPPPPYQPAPPDLERGRRTYSSSSSSCGSFFSCIGGTCGVLLILLFPAMLLAGLGTELGLSIVISKGLQEPNLDPSLTVKVACRDLRSPTTGVCGIPNHWSLGFAYASPIIAMGTVLWTWCCDTQIRYKFTGFAWFVVICTTIASVVGTTQLATKGYGADDCSKCPGKAVYVPLHRLRDMNRGQAAGAWFVVLGWVLSIVSFASAAN